MEEIQRLLSSSDDEDIKQAKNKINHLLICMRILKLLEFINTSTIKSKEDVVAKYINFLQKEELDDIQFEEVKDVLIETISLTFSAIKKEQLIVIYDSVWSLTTKGLEFYRDNVHIMYGDKENTFN